MDTLEFGLQKGDNVVIKVGSNVLTGKGDNDEGIDINNVKNIVSGIDYLMQLGINVFLVSSGAVSIGRKNFEKQGIIFEGNLTDDQKALLSANGQISLMSLYEELFLQRNILIAQNLLTHNTFKIDSTISNLRKVWGLSTMHKILAIINENDAISREELKFSDNDELAGLVAQEINAKILLLLSDIDGLFKGYGTEQQELITNVHSIDEIENYSVESKGGIGKGGMKSKINLFRQMMEKDIIGILANGGTQNIIQGIFKGTEERKTVYRNAA